MQAARLAIGLARQPEDAHEAVGAEAGRAEQLGQPPAHEAPHELELPQPVLGVAEALRGDAS